MDKIRLLFSKTGKAKYISNLDLMATMRRALLRAGIGLKYSEGFNPHPYMSVALPLPVGCGSECELMDIGVTSEKIDEGIPAAVTAMLPEGLAILGAYLPQRKFSSIAWIELSGVLYYDEGTPAGVVDKLSELFNESCIIIQKKTKSGISDIDIAPHVRNAKFFEDGEVTVKVTVSAQNPTINAENIMSAIKNYANPIAPDFALFTRREIYDSEMNVFR